MADPALDRDHHCHGVRDGRHRLGLLPGGGPSAAFCRDPRARHRRLKEPAEMTDKHWYIVQAYSNFERKVADSIREQAKQRHLDHLFDEVMVPTEKVVEVRRGQKVDAERNVLPGYVLVKMDLTDEA